MADGTLTLDDALFQEAYICGSVGATSKDYNSRPKGPDYHAELFPVHSPLLRESYLVSFPPLTYMLKFSGFPDLSSCRVREFYTTAMVQVPEEYHRSMSKVMRSRALKVLTDEVLPLIHPMRQQP